MKVLSIEMGNTEEIPTQSNYNGPNWDWTLTLWGIFIVARNLPCLRLGYPWHMIRSFQIDDVDANLKYEEENHDSK